MVYTRGQRSDYDALERLGNPGWGWADMGPALDEVESNGLHTSTVDEADPLLEDAITAGTELGWRRMRDVNDAMRTVARRARSATKRPIVLPATADTAGACSSDCGPTGRPRGHRRGVHAPARRGSALIRLRGRRRRPAIGAAAVIARADLDPNAASRLRSRCRGCSSRRWSAVGGGPWIAGTRRRPSAAPPDPTEALAFARPRRSSSVG